MALYSPSTYNSFHAKYTHEQCVKGGKSRAIKAKRNSYGLFLPANCDLSLPENYVHGRAGGLARAKQQKEKKMNSDTERSTKRILENGYYRQGQSLGEGGWGFLYSKGVDNWKTYVLFGDEPYPVEEITAKDDKTAIKAFSGLYHLEMLGDYEIIEKIVTTRLVKKANK